MQVFLTGRIKVENDVSGIINFILRDEELLFEGIFSEKFIRTELVLRRNKRDFYFGFYNKIIDNHRIIKNSFELRQLLDEELLEISEKCKKEASRLLDIVFSY